MKQDIKHWGKEMERGSSSTITIGEYYQKEVKCLLNARFKEFSLWEKYGAQVSLYILLQKLAYITGDYGTCSLTSD